MLSKAEKPFLWNEISSSWRSWSWFRHSPYGKRPSGVCKGEFTVPSDFNDPMPEIRLSSTANQTIDLAGYAAQDPATQMKHTTKHCPDLPR
jgi:hypothetical protein